MTFTPQSFNLRGLRTPFILGLLLEFDLFAYRTVMNAIADLGLKALLVDDNHVGQKIGARLLSSLGCVADVASNGREALEMCDREAYDLILMDCHMPVMDGYEATRVLRQQSDRYPIVIALTAHNLAEEKQKCFDAGMDDYLTKPITRDVLAAAIAHWQEKIQTRARS